MGPLEVRLILEQAVTPPLPTAAPVAEAHPVRTEEVDPLTVEDLVLPAEADTGVTRIAPIPKAQPILTGRGVAEGLLVVVSGADEVTFRRRTNSVVGVALRTEGEAARQTEDAVGVVDSQIVDEADPQIVGVVVPVIVAVMALDAVAGVEEGVAMAAVTNLMMNTVAVTKKRKPTKKVSPRRYASLRTVAFVKSQTSYDVFVFFEGYENKEANEENQEEWNEFDAMKVTRLTCGSFGIYTVYTVLI